MEKSVCDKYIVQQCLLCLPETEEGDSNDTK